MSDLRWVRALVVSGKADPALGLNVEDVSSVEAALVRLAGPGAFDVVLLGPCAATSDALAQLQREAPDVPIVVLPRVPTAHLRVAIEAVTRNPRTAATTARRVASLLPGYLDRRTKDVRALASALELEDFELIARTGHKLRGNGVSFGLPEVSAIGEGLEEAARARDVDGVRSAIERLRECAR